MDAPAQHAFLPPSGAAAWVVCALWPTMNARYPKPPTQAALEGEASHWAFYEIFYGRPVAVGQVAANGVTLNEEMIDGAQVFVDQVDEDLAACGLDRSHLRVEVRVYMPHIHAHNWGTPDVWFYDPTRGALYVYDYKFGHMFVDAYKNWQCADYASGILESFGLNGLQEQHIRVVIHVVQPRNYDRAGPVRRWEVVASDLRAFTNTLTSAANAAMLATPPAKVGDHCEFCPGRHACNTLQRAAYKAAHMSAEAQPYDLPPEALVLELDMLERSQNALEARVSGLREEVETRAKLKGERMPGWRIEDTFGRQTWRRPAEDIIAMGSMLGLTLGKPGVLTPLQAQKAGLPEALVEEYSHRPRIGVKLVRDDGTAANKVFGKRS